ncbi:MAG: hypothetical protein DWQ40_12525 [Actinobacteria bacterium]|nr:MAG: hypothetical protein DWQ40_12525 [Actinomycetota bacterium]
MRHPLETALALSLKALLLFGLPLSALFLILRSPQGSDELFVYSLTHLLVLQVITYLLVRQLAKLLDDTWFVGTKHPWLASSASLIALATGFAALLTIATAAAARYDVSMQYLQLLSSLDIAWVVSTLYIGARSLWGQLWGDVAAVALILACVASIAVYLAVVGFGPGGEWVVDGRSMLTIVLPSDVMAAVISVTTLLVASSRQPSVHLKPQS